MNKLIEASQPHMLKHYRSDTHWYISHTEGRLKITLTKVKPKATKYIAGATYYKNKSTTVSVTSEEEFNSALAANSNTLYYDNGDPDVQWILPDGTIINGLVVDAEVPAGETLCICSDFYACGIDASECDILTGTFRDMPPFQGRMRWRGNKKEPSAISEIPRQSAILGASNEYYIGGCRFAGNSSRPSKMRGTTKDINALLTGKRRTTVKIRYAPDITGDLAEFTPWEDLKNWDIYGTSTERKYLARYKDTHTTETTTDFTPEDYTMSFHHCGVHGVPIPGVFRWCIDWEYYACPNASPEDFDMVIDQLVSQWNYGKLSTAVNGVGFVWSSTSGGTVAYQPQLTCPSEDAILLGYSYEAGKPIIGAYGNLKISNRTADPVKRAEKLAILRAAGWTVEEVDDSLEEGIYATRDL